jgi:anti-sigma-K factor RskA
MVFAFLAFWREIPVATFMVVVVAMALRLRASFSTDLGCACEHWIRHESE